MTIETPAPKWRNFLTWAAIGAGFYLLFVLATSLLRDEGSGQLVANLSPVAAKLGIGLVFAAAVLGLAMMSQPANVRNVVRFAAFAGTTATLAYLGLRTGMQLHETGGLGEVGPSELVAGVIGFLYLLLAIVIGAGLPSPRFGALFLNVDDADELRDQRRMLAYAVAALGAMGVPLILLAFAGPGRALPPELALTATIVLLIAASLFAVAQWRLMDELMRNLSRECSAMTCYLIMTIGGLWVILAHLGFARGPAPLDWLSMFYALMLMAGFIVSGRRGLLKPR